MISLIVILWLLCGSVTVVRALRQFRHIFDWFDYVMCALALVLGPLSLAGWLIDEWWGSGKA